MNRLQRRFPYGVPWLILSGLGWVPTLACAPGAGAQARTPLPQPPYQLQASDVVEITFPFSPEYNQTVTVQPDGEIALKEAPAVKASGQTLAALQERIAAVYVGTLREPKVSVTLKDFQRPSFYASGELGHPGRYELRSSVSLLQAIAEAGGLLHDRAKRTEVVIFRPTGNGMFEAQVIDVKAMLDARTPVEGVTVRAGDVIYVPQNKFSKVSRFIPSANMGAYLTPGGL